MRYLVITINHSHAGFFAYVNFALNQIIYAEKHNLIPVVNFGPISGNGVNAYYDAKYGENIWDYYFSPVAEISFEALQARVKEPNDPLSHDDIVTLSVGQLWKIHCREPDSIYPYPHGMHNTAVINHDWYQQQRKKSYRLINDYIKVKSNILQKVDNFYDAHFSAHKILGIHMRGTDKGTANVRESLMRIIKPEEYYSHINEYIQIHPACRIFVATDQKQFLQRMINKYGERVLSYNSIRSDGYRSVFEKQDGQGYLKGEEVLIDTLLLSRCDYLIKCTSAVGEFAQYFNPLLQCIDLNLINYREDFFTKIHVKLKRKIHLLFIKVITLLK